MQTVISAFDDADGARRAAERLVQLGFDRDDVHLQPGHGATSVAGAEHDDALHRLGRFFGELFLTVGSDADASGYTRAVHRGCAVLAVDVHDAVQAARAVQALDELGGHACASDSRVADLADDRRRARLVDRPGGKPLRDLAQSWAPGGAGAPAGPLPGTSDAEVDREVIERTH